MKNKMVAEKCEGSLRAEVSQRSLITYLSWMHVVSPVLVFRDRGSTRSVTFTLVRLRLAVFHKTSTNMFSCSWRGVAALHACTAENAHIS